MMDGSAEAMAACEASLSSLCDRRFAVLSGRGATAIYAGLRALDAEPGRVILPATLCMSPANAVLYAGHEPVFCDIRLEDGTVDPQSVDKCLRNEKDVRAVLAAHLFGNPCLMKELEGICKRFGVALIEDAAQALGAEVEGRPAGGLGHFSIVSFGHTKILDAGGGGALLTDDADLADRARAALARLPKFSVDRDRLASQYRTLYYTLQTARRNHTEFELFFSLFPRVFKPLYLVGTNETTAQRVLSRLGGLASEVARRRHAWLTYQRHLGHLCHVLDGGSGAAPWRFTFRAPSEKRERLLTEVRKAGFDASSWYPSLHRWYRDPSEVERGSIARARQLEKEVVNLWVTADYPEGRIRSLCRLVRRLLEE